MPLARSATVLGAGVVGMSVAIELARADVAVTVLERGSVGGGASHGNAGLLVPSHCLPLARPAALLDGVAAILGSDAPLRLRPWQGGGELSWLARLAAACRPSGALVLSGILASQADAVVAGYRESFDILGVSRRDDWCCIRARRRASAVR